MEGLIFGGAYLRREICVSQSIGQALYLEANLPFLLRFTLYLRAIFQAQAPGELIFRGAIKRTVFCVTGLGGLYLERHIHGGAYFRNFTVPFLSSLGYLYIRWCKEPIMVLKHIIFFWCGPFKQ